MNIFARKIGFYYMNRDWAEKIFDKITSMTDKEYIERMIKSNTLMEIVYKDGTVVRFHKATDQARGYRHHLAYMEAGLSYDIYSTLVMPKIMFKEYGGGQVFVLSSAEALFHEWSDDGFCMDARDYFRMYNKEHYEKIVKQIDERIKKECEIASVNDAIGTQIKLSRLEAISKLGEWAAENPETAECMKRYIDDHETLEEMEEGIDAALRRAKKYAPAMIRILDDCK